MLVELVEGDITAQEVDVSAGIYRWPVQDAVRQALSVLRPAEPVSVNEARLVLFGQDVYTIASGVDQDGA